jgi:hypothetical protein
MDAGVLWRRDVLGQRKLDWMCHWSGQTKTRREEETAVRVARGVVRHMRFRRIGWGGNAEKEAWDGVTDRHVHARYFC